MLPTLRSGQPLQLVVDGTGLKVFGEGEWGLVAYATARAVRPLMQQTLEIPNAMLSSSI